MTISDAPIFAQWIHDRNPNVVARLPTETSNEYSILVAIKGATYEYKAQIIAMIDSVPINETNDVITCSCNSETFLNILDREIEAAVEKLREFSPDDLKDDTDRTDESAKIDQTDDPYGQNYGAGPLGYTGIILGLLGGTSVAMGIPLALQGNKPERRDSKQGFFSTRAPGIALATAGSAVLAAGIAVFIVDRLRSNSRSVTITPTASPESAGLQLRARF
ncbi:MAG: hypothetical protein AAGF11_35740 [Myxococcota bacterium]